MKMLIDICLDGYGTREDYVEACREYILDQLNMTASSIEILWDDDAKDDGIENVGK